MMQALMVLAITELPLSVWVTLYQGLHSCDYMIKMTVYTEQHSVVGWVVRPRGNDGPGDYTVDKIEHVCV